MDLLLPNITAIRVISSNRTWVDLNVTVARNGSTVYCGVYSSFDRSKSSSLTSASAIISQGNFVFVSGLNIQLRVGQLIASTSYIFMCTAVSAKGYKASFDSSLGNAVTASTSCCKSIQVTSQQSVVSSGKTYSSFLQVSLDGLPASSISLSMKYDSANTSAKAENGVFLYPSTYIFTNNSLTSTASFILSSSAIASGTYILSLTVEGGSQNEYSTTFVRSSNQVIVSVSYIEPQTPSLVSVARYSKDGSYLTIEFDAATNRAMYYNNFPCSLLFNFLGIGRSTCLWRNDLTIEIYQPYGSDRDTLQVGGNITFYSSTPLKAACNIANQTVCKSWAPIAGGILKVSSPLDPTNPIVNVAVPSTISACQAMRIDLASSSGAAGRPWAKYTITADAVGQQVDTNSDINVFFADKSRYTLSPPTAIPSSMLTPKGSQLSFTVKLCNFLGFCGIATAVTSVLSETDPSVVPVVSLVGASAVTQTPTVALIVQVDGYVQTCSDTKSYANLVYEWELQLQHYSGLAPVNISAVQQKVRLLKSSSQNPAIFRLPAYSLIAPATYSLISRVYSSAGSSATRGVGTAVTTVIVNQGPLVAVIKGGSRIVSTVGKQTTIDGSQSYDSDGAASTTSLKFKWTCVQTAPVFNQTCANILTLSSSTILTSKLVITPVGSAAVGTSSIVTLTVSDGYSRSTTGSATVTVSAQPVPVISITTPPASLMSIPTGKRLSLTASVSLVAGTVSVCSWQVDDVTVNITKSAVTPLTRSFSASATGVLSTSVLFNLVLAPSTLPQRASLIFSISCNANSVRSSITVTTNGAPLPGFFLVDPASGTSLSTIFAFSASNWNDPDLPITFQFNFQTVSNTAPLTLSSRSAAAFVSTTLPVGQVRPLGLASEPSVNCSVLVFDVFNASASLFRYVVVSSVATAEARQAQLQQYLQSTTTTGDVESQKRLLAVASSAVNAVNCSSLLTPNCAVLNREPCSRTSFSCGVCQTGFISASSGDSNEPCVSIPSSSGGGGLGSTCSASSPCASVYQECVSGFCQYKARRCPYDCSGHGECLSLYTSTGIEIDSCPLNQFDCTAICVCAEGYSGVGCESEDATVAEAQAVRSLLVNTLLNLTASDDVTAENVQSWSDFLEAISGNPYELGPEDIVKMKNTSLTTMIAAKNIKVGVNNVLGVLASIDSIQTAMKTFYQTSRRRMQTSAFNTDYHRALLENTVTLNEMSTMLLSITSTFSDLVSQSKVYGEDASVYVYNNFRLVSSIEAAQDNSNLSLTVPASELEQISDAPQTSLSMILSANSSSTSTDPVTFSSNLIQTLQKVYTSNMQSFFSDPVRLSIVLGDNQNSLNETVDETAMFSSVYLTVRNNPGSPSVFGNETVVNFTTSCVAGDRQRYYFTCPFSGVQISHSCPGVAGEQISFCPQVEPSCSEVNLKSLGVTEYGGCVVVNITSTYTTCVCDLTVSNRRRLIDQGTKKFLDESGATDFVAATVFMAQDFRDTFNYADDLSSKDGFKKSMIMILLFVIMWGIGLGLFLFINVYEQEYMNPGSTMAAINLFFVSVFFLFGIDYIRGSKIAGEIKDNSGTNLLESVKNSVRFSIKGVEITQLTGDIEAMDGESLEKQVMVQLAEQMKKRILYYVESIVPTIYDVRESYFQRTWREIGLHHRYLHITVPDTRRPNVLDRFYRTMSILTVQTMTMFLQALLYDLENPVDDGSCEQYSTLSQAKCLERRTIFDSDLTYCQWSTTSSGANRCTYNDRGNTSNQAVLYVIIISSIIATMFKMPVDSMLAAWISPTKDEVTLELNQETPATPEKNEEIDELQISEVVNHDELLDLDEESLDGNAADFHDSIVPEQSPLLIVYDDADPAATGGHDVNNLMVEDIESGVGTPHRCTPSPGPADDSSGLANARPFFGISTAASILPRLMNRKRKAQIAPLQVSENIDETNNQVVVQADVKPTLASPSPTSKPSSFASKLSFLSGNEGTADGSEKKPDSEVRAFDGGTKKLIRNFPKKKTKRQLMLQLLGFGDNAICAHSVADGEGRSIPQLLYKQHDEAAKIFMQMKQAQMSHLTNVIGATEAVVVNTQKSMVFDDQVDVHRRLSMLAEKVKEDTANAHNESDEVDMLCRDIVEFRAAQFSDPTSKSVELYDRQWGLLPTANMTQILTSQQYNDAFLPETKDTFLSTTVEMYDELEKMDPMFQKLTSMNAGVELMHLFMIDLLGRNTKSAIIFRHKFNEEFTKLNWVTQWYKNFSFIGIFLLNGFFIYYSLLRGLEKGLKWQYQFMVSVVVQLVVEIFLFETLECLWIHFLVPESVRNDVQKAIRVLQLLAQNTEDLILATLNHEAAIRKLELGGLLNPFEDDDYHGKNFDAPSYLFLSKQLAKSRPELIESHIVLAYRNHFPGLICRIWPHYQQSLQTGWGQQQPSSRQQRGRDAGAAYLEDAGAPESRAATRMLRATQAGSAWMYGCIVGMSAGILYLLQSLGSLPMMYQRIIVGMLQQTFLSGLTLLWFFAMKNLPYFALFVVVIFFLCGFVAIRYAVKSPESPIHKAAVSTLTALDRLPIFGFFRGGDNDGQDNGSSQLDSPRNPQPDGAFGNEDDEDMIQLGNKHMHKSPSSFVGWSKDSSQKQAVIANIKPELSKHSSDVTPAPPTATVAPIDTEKPQEPIDTNVTEDASIGKENDMDTVSPGVIVEPVIDFDGLVGEERTLHGRAVCICDFH
jgi:hypothetical protein